MSGIVHAIGKGSTFLLAQQDARGLWHDTQDPSGDASLWMSGYVTRSLWFLASTTQHVASVERALETARHELSRRQRRNGGWGASRTSPTEADTTAWVLWSMLDEPGWAPFSIARARRYLRAHWDSAGGGFRLWVPGLDTPRDGVDASAPGPPLAEPDPCLTAVAVRGLVDDPSDPVIRAACTFLKREQSEDGLWRSPRWAVSGCATLTALGALFVADQLDEGTLTAARHGLEVLMKEAHGYELASALMTAPRLGLANLGDSLDRLLAEQDEDGSWTPSSPVRATVGGADEGTTSTLTGSDPAYEDRLLTTSAALGALGVNQ